MGANQLDKDKEMLKYMKSMVTHLEKLVVSATGSATGIVSGIDTTNQTRKKDKSESNKIVDKIEKSMRAALMRDKLLDYESQRRREAFIGKVMENKILRPFYTTFKSLEGHTVNLFRDLQGAWSGVYGKVFSQITEAFRPITGSIMAIYNFAKGISKNIFDKIGEKLWSDDIGGKIEDSGKKTVSSIDNVKDEIQNLLSFFKKEKKVSVIKDSDKVKKKGLPDEEVPSSTASINRLFQIRKKWLPIELRIRDRWQKVKDRISAKTLAFGGKWFGKTQTPTGPETKRPIAEGGILAGLMRVLQALPFLKMAAILLGTGLIATLFPSVRKFLTDPATWQDIFTGIGKTILFLLNGLWEGVKTFFGTLLKIPSWVGEGGSLFVDIPKAMATAVLNSFKEGNLAAIIGAGFVATFTTMWGIKKIKGLIDIFRGTGLTGSAIALDKAAAALSLAAAKLGGGSVTDVLTGKGGKLGKFARVARFLANPATLITAAAAGSIYAGMDDRGNRKPGDVFADLSGNLITVDEKGNEISLEQYEESKKQTKLADDSKGFLEKISDSLIKILGPTEAAASIIPPSTGASKMSPEIKSQIEAAAKKYGIPAENLLAMAQFESGGNPLATSQTGAKGIFQFTSGTANQYGLKDPYNAAENIDAGARLYRDNYKEVKRLLGRNPTSEEMYLAHNQGAQGVYEILKAAETGDESIISKNVRKNMDVQGAKFKGMSAKNFVATMSSHFRSAGISVGTTPTTPTQTELAKGGKAPGTNVAAVRNQEKSLTLLEYMKAADERSKAENTGKATLVASTNVSNTAVSNGRGSGNKDMNDLPRSISDLFGLQQAVILNSVG